MKYNKLNAFTLAEVMVLLLTLTILMAAFAPVFTTRYSGGSVDDVWTFVSGDDNYDAYYDALNKNYTAQAFIGLTPASKVDVTAASSNTEGLPVYSKLVIRASDRINVGNGNQNQMQFRYGNSAAGSVVGSLFAGNGNFLLGGVYNSVGDNSKWNTAYGSHAMDSVTSGTANTAVGYYAMNNLTTGSYNTAVGNNAAKKLKSGIGNIFIGNASGSDTSTTSTLKYNTVVGNNSGQKLSGSYNTAIGISSMSAATSASYNSALGENTLAKFTTGSYNTAVGFNAMNNLTTGSYNTAVGYNACLNNTNGSYVTCIGYRAGSTSNKSIASKLASASNSMTPDSKIFSGDSEDSEVVLIGSMPVHSVSNPPAAAVLEVHNRKTKNVNLPLAAGNETVVINGNLIVRGRTYMEVPIIRPINSSYSDKSFKPHPKGLVAHALFKYDDHSPNFYAFGGYDGVDREGASRGKCDRYCLNHRMDDIRPNCICTSSYRSNSTYELDKASSGTCGNTNTTYNTGGATQPVSSSYDWATQVQSHNGTSGSCDDAAASYTDASTGCTVKLENYGPIQGGNYSNRAAGNKPGTDKPLAHWPDNDSCCPNLKSDIRLKNVGDRFTAGLDELKKLNIYNYTFKNDPDKMPHVGVIAQDLKLIFPNAVSKDDRGYYQIRWDEMFYAAINSIKTLNTKIENLASRVVNDRNRIASLKKDNEQLNAQLDKLADEVAKLEVQKHK